MEKDAVGQGNTWKSYEKSKSEMKKGNGKSTKKNAASSVFSEVPPGNDSLAHHLCRHWGSAREKGQEGGCVCRDGYRWFGRAGLDAGFAGSL